MFKETRVVSWNTFHLQPNCIVYSGLYMMTGCSVKYKHVGIVWLNWRQCHVVNRLLAAIYTHTDIHVYWHGGQNMFSLVCPRRNHVTQVIEKTVMTEAIQSELHHIYGNRSLSCWMNSEVDSSPRAKIFIRIMSYWFPWSGQFSAANTSNKIGCQISTFLAKKEAATCFLG